MTKKIITAVAVPPLIFLGVQGLIALIAAEPNIFFLFGWVVASILVYAASQYE